MQLTQKTTFGILSVKTNYQLILKAYSRGTHYNHRSQTRHIGSNRLVVEGSELAISITLTVKSEADVSSRLTSQDLPQSSTNPGIKATFTKIIMDLIVPM